tara:strand:- start:25 stop:678 length:654 start_codon:yes stop_codon:yes gene_type:complete
MNKKELTRLIQKELDYLYPETTIPLHHRNEFELLIAVILSAQSTDKKVNELTPKLFKDGSTPEDLFRIGQQEILNRIKQLGLANNKAKNVYLTSKRLIDDYNSNVPNNFQDLESLPGVGHKTASVVMSQAFGFPAFPVDTHIHRLAQRWELTSGINVVQTERDLKKIFPKKSWNKLHLQIIFYGREFCTAKGCNGTKCRLCKKFFPNRTKSIIHRKA